MRRSMWVVCGANALAALLWSGHARAQSPATCSFDAASGTVSVTVDQTEAVVTRTAAGIIRLGGVACGGATVFNTDTIVITGGTASDRVSLNGDYSPGRTNDAGKSEIEVQLSSIESLTLVLSEGNDILVATATGVDVGDDGDVDITGRMPQTVHAGGGNDLIDFSLGGGPTLRGGAGNDHLIGGPFSDDLFGGEGHDIMEGRAGNERLDGGPGDDIQLGGEGHDMFVIAPTADGADLIDGGNGGDQVDYGQRTADITVTNSVGDADDGEIDEGDDITRVERIITGSGDDFIIGTNGTDIVDAGDGNDEIIGGGDHDTLVGGPGDDTLQGDEGRNTLNAGDGNDVVISSSPSDDRINAGAGDDLIIGNADGNLDLIGCGPGFDTAEAAPEDTFFGDCEVLQ